MKNENNHAQNLVKLLKKFKALVPKEAPDSVEPIRQMVLGFLEWNATAQQADDAYEKILQAFVDMNDLRISLPHEVLDVIGHDYPQAIERVVRMHESLNGVFQREHGTTLEVWMTKPKKQLRAYLDSLQGMVPYVAAKVMLLSFASHAIPVDDQILLLLKENKAVLEKITTLQAQTLLERQVKANDAAVFHIAMRLWADQSPLLVGPEHYANSSVPLGGAKKIKPTLIAAKKKITVKIEKTVVPVRKKRTTKKKNTATTNVEKIVAILDSKGTQKVEKLKRKTKTIKLAKAASSKQTATQKVTKKVAKKASTKNITPKTFADAKKTPKKVVKKVASKTSVNAKKTSIKVTKKVTPKTSVNAKKTSIKVTKKVAPKTSVNTKKTSKKVPKKKSKK